MKQGKKLTMSFEKAVQKLRRADFQEAGHILKQGETFRLPYFYQDSYGDDKEVVNVTHGTRDLVPRWMLRALRERNNLTRKQLASMLSKHGITENQIARWLQPNKDDYDLLPINITDFVSLKEFGDLGIDEIFKDCRIPSRTSLDYYWGFVNLDEIEREY